jgi:hypothetical protein
MRRYFAGEVVESDVARQRRRLYDGVRARARHRGTTARGNARGDARDVRLQALDARSRRETRWKTCETRKSARASAGRGLIRRLQHHGKVHRPSLGGGPMTTTNKNKSKAAAPTPATANLGDVHQFKTKSSSARMRSLASASGARLRAYDRVVSLSSAFTRASACEMLS